MNIPDLSNIDLIPRRVRESEARTNEHFQEIRYLYNRAESAKKQDQTIALSLHLPTGIVSVKRIYTSKPGTLIFETYDDSSHTLMAVPIEQCIVSVHVFKEENYERRFMGFPTTPPPYN